MYFRVLISAEVPHKQLLLTSMSVTKTRACAVFYDKDMCSALSRSSEDLKALAVGEFSHPYMDCSSKDTMIFMENTNVKQ